MGEEECKRQHSETEQLGYDFMAAAFEVYNILGAGFLEEVYQESLERELLDRQIEYVAKPSLNISYKSIILMKGYEADFVIGKSLLIEIKAARALAPEHEAQVFNYLRATKLRVGYLLNFGASPRLQWRRYIL